MKRNLKLAETAWMVEEDVDGTEAVFLSEARAKDYLESALETYGEPTWHETSTGWAVEVDDGAGFWSGSMWEVAADLAE